MRTVLNNSIPSQSIRHNLKKKNFNSPIFVKLKIVSKEIFKLEEGVSLTHHLGHLVHKRLRPSRCKPSFRETLPASCDTLLPNADTSYDFLDKTPKGCLSAGSVAIWGQKVQKNLQSLALGKLVTAFRMR